MLTNFQKKVLALANNIPEGKITTYGEMAKALRSGSRAVGRALGANPYPVKIPCHRVVHADGSLGGYLGGIKKKRELLRREGIEIKNQRIIDLIKRYFYKF